jgi:microcystin-dependent protein
MPIGAISLWGTAKAPANWLLCDGSAISRSTYADLFDVIGTTWGAADGVAYPFLGTQNPTTSSPIIWFNLSAAPPIWYQTAGNVFTITGGAAGLSTYIYTITSYSANTIFATAKDIYGFAVTTFIAGVYNTTGSMTISTPTYFNVPDTGNKTIRGTKSGTLAPNAQAGSDSTSVTLFAANLPPHRHGFTVPGVATVASVAGISVLQAGWNASQIITNANQTYAEDGTTLTSSLPFSVATTNPYIAIPYIIKYT